jgi:integrase
VRPGNVWKQKAPALGTAGARRKGDIPVTGFVDDAKLDQLRDAASKVGLWMRTFVELGATYGWRRGEMLGLRCQQVDFEPKPDAKLGIVRLETGTTKNNHGREVPLTSAVRLLLEQCCHGKKPSDHVLTRGRSPRPVQDVRCAWRNLCIKVGLGQWRCRTPQCDTVQAKRKRCPKCKRRNWEYLGLLVHDMRRTGVRNLRRAGVAEEVAMTISGHRTSSTFRRYDIVCNEDKAVALQKLEQAQQRSRTARAAQLARKAEGSHNTDITAPARSARVQ